MSQIPKWFERKFDFSFPAEFYPNICIRLRGTPARLEELVRGGSREMLIHKREGKWSAQEHAGHLLDLEPLGMARMRDFVQGGKELTPADLGNRRTHEANHNAKPIEEIVSEFRKERMAMMDYVGQQESPCLDRRWCIRGSSSLCDWWTTSISWLSMMTIIWRGFGS